MKKFVVLLSLSALIFTSCYSVFSGGTGGMVADSESTATPKAGIANVDVYAYTDSGTRNSEFSAWKEGTVFTPSADYYGHTTTAGDGSFSLSKLVWKKGAFKSSFGKDADVQTIYLIFYHENYGLTKAETIVVSDSSSDAIYVELTAVRKTTVLNLNFEDVSTGARAEGRTMYVEVTVPQTTASNTAAPAKVYKRSITGSGSINISYPRWQSDEAKAAQEENQPEIKISYVQSADKITWKACHNNETGDYAFYDDGFKISKTVKNPVYDITLYGKPTELRVPVFAGTYGDVSSAASDGVVIALKAKGSGASFNIDCGEVTTAAQLKGTTSEEKHGVFSGLGGGAVWEDNSYTEKYAQTEVQFYANGTELKTMTVRSDTGSYNVRLN